MLKLNMILRIGLRKRVGKFMWIESAARKESNPYFPSTYLNTKD